MAKTLTKLTLKEWIEKTGPERVAKLLGVNISSVGHWHRGYCSPRDEVKILIKKLSRGAVTYDEMIERTHSKENGPNHWKTTGKNN